MTEKANIPFIHNYCDRWCERCSFTSRCAVFEAEQETTDEEKDINNDAFWRNLANIFAETKRMLTEQAEELGIDLNNISDEKYEEHRKRERKIIADSNLTKLTKKYAFDARPILAAKDDWLMFSPLDEEANGEMLSIIFWYQFFISAKIQRGLHGILDFDGNEDLDEINDVESDANGSVKVGLIAIERSIMAWTNLMSNENAATIKPFIKLLEIIKQKTETKFPHAKEFIRPGFDEIEMVM
jgi:hypothetical protein